jgi:hypothetical protein
LAPNGSHRQWDAAGDGCLLDAERLSWTELQAERASNPRKFRLVYQQEDVDPAGAFVDPAWLEGGVDRDGILSPGCYDTDRGFMQWPAGVTGLLDYVTIDPSAGNFWGVEWWAIAADEGPLFAPRGSGRASSGPATSCSGTRRAATSPGSCMAPPLDVIDEYSVVGDVPGHSRPIPRALSYNLRDVILNGKKARDCFRIAVVCISDIFLECLLDSNTALNL